MPSTKRFSPNEATLAVSLAVLLDGRRGGMTLDEIRDSGVLGTWDDADATFIKRFQRAQGRLGEVGFALREVRGIDGQTRYSIDSSLTYAQKNYIELTSEEAQTLASLIAYCLQGPFPFSAELRQACRRVLSIAQRSDVLSDFAELEIDDAEANENDRNAPGASGESHAGSRGQTSPGGKPHADDPDVGRGEDGIVRVASQALTSRRPFLFSYEDAHGNVSERILLTYAIEYADGRCYLMGHDALRDDMRMFRLDRILTSPAPRIDEKARPYEIPLDFDPREHLKLPFQYGSDETAVELTFVPLRNLDKGEWESLTGGKGKVIECESPCRNEGEAAGTAPHTRWVVEAYDLELAASWATQALLDDNLLPVAPTAFVEMVKDGILRSEVMHG